jgi:O-antigen/teichoic acid export membrane protein
MDLGVGVREVAAARGRLSEMVPAVFALRLVLACGLVASVGLGALLWNTRDGQILALYTLTLLPLAAGARWVLTGLERTAAVGIARTIGELATLCAIALFVHRGEDLWRIPVAQVAGDTLATIILAIRLRRLGIPYRPRWNGAVVRRLARHVAPYVGSTLLGLVIYNSDLLFLRFLRDEETVGYYAAAYALISFLINVSITYSLTLLPAFSRLEEAPEAQRELYADSVAHALTVAIPIVVGGAMLAEPIVRLAFGPSFVRSALALRILVATVPLFAVRDIAMRAVMTKGREDLIFSISWQSAVLNVALNLLLVPPFGMAGAATATVLTEAVRVTFCALAAHRVGFPRPPIGRAWRAIAAVLVMGATLLLLESSSIWVAVLGAALAYAAALFAVRGLTLRQGSWLPSLSV